MHTPVTQGSIESHMTLYCSAHARPTICDSASSVHFLPREDQHWDSSSSPARTDASFRASVSLFCDVTNRGRQRGREGGGGGGGGGEIQRVEGYIQMWQKVELWLMTLIRTQLYTQSRLLNQWCQSFLCCTDCTAVPQPAVAQSLLSVYYVYTM